MTVCSTKTNNKINNRSDQNTVLPFRWRIAAGRPPSRTAAACRWRRARSCVCKTGAYFSGAWAGIKSGGYVDRYYFVLLIHPRPSVVTVLSEYQERVLGFLITTGGNRCFLILNTGSEGIRTPFRIQVVYLSGLAMATAASDAASSSETDSSELTIIYYLFYSHLFMSFIFIPVAPCSCQIQFIPFFSL